MELPLVANEIVCTEESLLVCESCINKVKQNYISKTMRKHRISNHQRYDNWWIKKKKKIQQITHFGAIVILLMWLIKETEQSNNKNNKQQSRSACHTHIVQVHSKTIRSLIYEVVTFMNETKRRWQNDMNY